MVKLFNIILLISTLTVPAFSQNNRKSILNGTATGNELPLSFTSPLTRSNNGISISQANTTTDGILQASDYNKIQNTHLAIRNVCDYVAGMTFYSGSQGINITIPTNPTADILIRAAIADLPYTGGVVDARCLPGTTAAPHSTPAAGNLVDHHYKLMTNIYQDSYNRPIYIYFGAAKFEIYAQQIVTSGSQIWGVSNPGASDGTQFINGCSPRFIGDTDSGCSTGPVPALSGVAGNNLAMIVMGGPYSMGAVFGVQIHNISLFCQGVNPISGTPILTGPGSHMTGISNVIAEEQSYVKDFFISNCNIGLDVNGAGAQNSGPYQNGIIYGPGLSDSSTIAVKIQGVSIRNFDNFTVFNAATGFNIGAATTVSNSHCEFATDCFLLNNHGITLINVNGSSASNSVKNVVHITSGVQYANLFGITEGWQGGIVNGIHYPANVTILDDASHVTLTDYLVGSYLLGTIAGVPTRITTNSEIPSSFYGLQILAGPNPTPGAPCTSSSNDIGSLWMAGSGSRDGNIAGVLNTCVGTTTGFQYTPFQWAGQYDQPSPVVDGNGKINTDPTKGTLSSITLIANSTLSLGTGFPGMSQTVEICNGTTAYTLSWGSDVRGGGVFSAGTNLCQSQTFRADNVKGHWIAASSMTAPWTP